MGYWSWLPNKQNRFSDLIKNLEGRVSALPFSLLCPHLVSLICSPIMNTTTIMDTNQKAEIINTTLSMSKYNYSEADLIMALIKTILLIVSTTI